MQEKHRLLAAALLGAVSDAVLEAIMPVEGPEGPEPWAEPEEGAVAVSREFADGMTFARRQFAGQEENRFAAERAAEIERMEREHHLNTRSKMVTLAVSAASTETALTHVGMAQLYYDFACFGAARANLGLATNAELGEEISARMSMGHIDPSYRTVDGEK